VTGPEIRIESLRRTYRIGDEEAVALDGIDLVIDGGAAAAIMGPSGSGKSTLTAILAGLDRPTSGRVLIGGEDIGRLSERALLSMRSSTVALTVQRPDRNLLGYGTALDNVRFAQRGVRRRRRRALPDARGLLARVGLERQTGQPVDRLSGGERQRLALAVGLASGAGLLLLDEPTSQLDDDNRDAITALMLEIHAEFQPTLVAVTHDSALAARFERLVVLEDGRVA
jgi:putative ABC transport system ATP-binding protein